MTNLDLEERVKVLEEQVRNLTDNISHLLQKDMWYQPCVPISDILEPPQQSKALTLDELLKRFNKTFAPIKVTEKDGK